MAKVYKIILSLAVLFFGVLPFAANAASLSFSSVADSYAVGNTFSVNVNVASTDQAMNAASGIVSFPNDKLEVVSVSKSGSIFSLWVQEPSFSNNAGAVSFEGIILNPGYIGGSGKIVTITFRTKNPGAANLSFSSGSILANDGTGANILSGTRGATINIGAKTAPVSAPAPTALPEPAIETVSSNTVPKITSLTHPNQTKWYSDNRPEFTWNLPKGAIEVRTAIGSSPNGQPTVRYAPPIKSKKVDALADGTYYFHLQIRTASGWGETAHYRVNIDATPPEPFTIKFPHGNDIMEPQPVILFNTTDGGSGIDRYDVKIGNGGPDRIAPSATSNPYPLPPQEPGSHTVTVTAIDIAGNTTTSSDDFTIESIEAPIITYYPKELESGDIFKIRGTTYPNSDVTLFIRDEIGLISEEHTKSNSLGDFGIVAAKRLDVGNYTFTVNAADLRGAKSLETKPLPFAVTSTFKANIIENLLDYLSIAVLAIVLLTCFVWLVITIWHKSIFMHRKLKSGKTIIEPAQNTGKQFDTLANDIDNHISALRKSKSKHKLVAAEIKFLEAFKKDMDVAERIVQKGADK